MDAYINNCKNCKRVFTSYRRFDYCYSCRHEKKYNDRQRHQKSLGARNA